MTPFPRADYGELRRYEPGRRPVALDLSDNTNLWGAHPAGLERIRSATIDDVARYPELYADGLRATVAEHFGIAPECVTTGAGSDDVIDCAFRAASGPGACVAFAAPTFSMIEPFARMNGMSPRPVPWAEALDDPGRLLRDDPSVVYVCRPNNPTGQMAPAGWVDDLIAACADAASPPLLVMDEAYADFARETLLPRAAELTNVLVARTASKAYGLAGLRCGFGVGSAEVVLEVDKARGPYKLGRLAAEAAAAALRDEDGWMAAVIAETLTNRDRLAAALAERGLEPLESRANFLLLAAPSGSAHEDTVALRAAGVAVRPFTGIPEIGEGLRVTVGPWPMMETFLAALDHVRSTVGPGR